MVDAAKLRAAFGWVIAAEPHRYVQRSALMGFPDTIVVRFFDRAGGRSTLALYSRSQLGHVDMGVNRAHRTLAREARGTSAGGAMRRGRCA